MPRKTKNDFCCSPDMMAGCKIESLLTVDERGQMVLPKEVRENAGIRPGEKLALITWRRQNQIQCLALIKVDNLTAMVKGLLGPMAEEILSTKENSQ